MSLHEHLITKEDNPNLFSPAFLNRKRSEFFEKLVRKEDERDRLIAAGWCVRKINKKSVRMGFPKKPDVAFNDRVWSLFARMGFDYLNDGGQFRLNYSSNDKRQIDVFAADDEAIFIIECKSSEATTKVDFKSKILELVAQKDGLRGQARNLFTRDHKVAFIWATNNCVLSGADKQRLLDNDIIHFNQDDIDYFEQMTGHLGSAAKYQLYGKIFENKKIPNFKNRFPALEGKFPNGETFYIFNIEPENLLRIGYVLHRNDTNIETSNAYQRIVNKTRLSKIRKYVSDGGYFANSILVNISVRRRQEIKFEPVSLPENDSTDCKVGVIHLPKVYRRAFIIDGQHRLYGYTNTSQRFNTTIPVVAFINIDNDVQEKLFIDINHEQKSVPSNLLRSLMTDFNFGADDLRKAIPALKAKVFIDLNNTEDSPFYKRIKVSEEPATQVQCLTIQTLINWGLNTKTQYFGELKGKNLVDYGFLLVTTGDLIDHEASAENAKQFFNAIFNYLAMQCKDQWDLGNEKGRGFIATNLGVSATLLIINDMLIHLREYEKIQIRRITINNLVEKVTKYLIPITDLINNLSQEEIQNLRGLFGSGAPPKVQRIFQASVNEVFLDFEPAGLGQWLTERKGEYTDKAREQGFKYIEPAIHQHIMSELKRIHGEKDWWMEGVPDKVDDYCHREKRHKRSREELHTFLNLIHYRAIIHKDRNWPTLGNIYTEPGMENRRKELKTEWLEKLNRIRAKYSHPQKEPVTQSEYDYLMEIKDWLLPRITSD